MHGLYPVSYTHLDVYKRQHYYGGIKKYQWPCIPLALCGVIYTQKGKKIEVNIGTVSYTHLVCP